jgi:phenylacetate-CoA ligase
MFSWYGHSEKVVLAAECEHSTDYHVWPTYGHFELLDETGHPVTKPGARGEIVGTGFINTVVPFIRYRTGDYATYVGDRCEACGREHIIIRDVLGHRTQEMLVARDGSLISWTAINMHDDTFRNVRQFQFRQDRPGLATLRIVSVNGFSEADRERLELNLRLKLDGRIVFNVELTDEIRLTPRGKTTYVDQRLDLNRTRAEQGVPA